MRPVRARPVLGARDALADLKSFDILAESLQLRRCGKPYVHQLHFVHYPKAILVKQAEFHRPVNDRLYGAICGSP